MVLSKKSWHYWLYKQFFTRTPTNLCSYFWKALISIIFVTVAFILSLPWALIRVLINDPFEDEDDRRLGPMTGLGLISWFVLFTAVSMILMFFSKKNVIIALGGTGWLISASLLVVVLVEYLLKKKPLSKTLLGEFIKAKKGKYCPSIEWKDEPKRFDLTEND